MSTSFFFFPVNSAQVVRDAETNGFSVKDKSDQFAVVTPDEKYLWFIKSGNETSEAVRYGANSDADAETILDALGLDYINEHDAMEVHGKGGAAREERLTADQCPYAESDIRRVWWMDGYEDAGDPIEESSISRCLIESTTIPSPKELRRALEKCYPRNASDWSQATDEVCDLARGAREMLGEPESSALDFRKLGNPNAGGSPAKWNSQGIDYIVKAYARMGAERRSEYVADYGHLWQF